MRGPRVIITGSRDWDDPRTIRVSLARWHGPHTTLVSGACPTGADAIAEEFAAENGWTIERHPAQWDTLGKRAGFVRNNEMAALGADVCVAFRRNNSRGTGHMINAAHKAGIPVVEYLYVPQTGARGGWGV